MYFSFGTLDDTQFVRERDRDHRPQWHRQQCKLVRTADSVSDRGSKPDHIARSEYIIVVQNVIYACLRADKHIPPDVVSDACSHIHEEMVGTGIAVSVDDAVR